MRVFEPLGLDVLREILDCAIRELDRFLMLAGRPPGKFKVYGDRLITISLCQGSAQHFVDLQGRSDFDNIVLVTQRELDEKGYRVTPTGRIVNGVNDIDVCLFFQQLASVPIPNRNHCIKSATGRFSGLGERRLDFLKKGVSREVIGSAGSSEPTEVIRSYMRNTPHGRQHLSRKSVIGLYPARVFGKVLWRSLRAMEGSDIHSC